jgi:hypothetical protein
LRPQGWSFEASPAKKVTRPYLKNTQHRKRAGSVAQVVKHRLSKCEALSSHPNTTIEKKITNYFVDTEKSVSRAYMD